jgi:hypothetical protein
MVLDKDNYLTYDVANMVTNCPIDELLSAVEKAYSKFDETKYDLKSPPTKDIIYLLKFILENLMGNYTNKILKRLWVAFLLQRFAIF